MSRTIGLLIIACAISVCNWTGRQARAERTAPPFKGIAFLSSEVITPEDPSTFDRLEFAGQGRRAMFDRRKNDDIQVEAWLFRATFRDREPAVEVQVNPEFSREEAEREARRYLPVIGRIPRALREDVETVWIHKGDNPFGGGNRNLLIHTGQGESYFQKGVIEEIFLHEACHTSLDADHANAPKWREAQKADARFISNYSRDYPLREDIAESFGAYVALRHKRDRLKPEVARAIEEAIPNRIAYFDSLGLDLRPVANAE